MICWSCERATESPDALCVHCKAVQPADAAADHFAVLGIARRYAIDAGEAEGRFKELSRQVHPDRFAKADPRARRASLGRTVQLNEAWRTLKDPVRRAEYLLGRAGYAIAAEEGASAPAAGDAGRVRIGAPPALLMEILELREELGEARAAGDEARVQRMAADMRGRAASALAGAGAALTTAEGAEGEARATALEAAARELIALRYFRRFLDEVDVHDEARAAAGGEASHA